MCLQGLGCDVDNSRALQLFRQAAELGHSDAQYNLAMLYETGRIVELDYQQAASWYRLAVDQGHANAQFQLGLMFQEGRGAPQNFHQAAALFSRAAEQGHALAQYNLACLYQQGVGVPQDNQQAYVWSSLAVAGGCRQSEAQSLRDNMARLLNSAQLVEAQREATLFFEQWQLQA